MMSFSCNINHLGTKITIHTFDIIYIQKPRTRWWNPPKLPDLSWNGPEFSEFSFLMVKGVRLILVYLPTVDYCLLLYSKPDKYREHPSPRGLW